MKIRILIFISFICWAAVPLFAQTKNADSLNKKNVRLDQTKPTAYLEFVKIEKRNETINLGCLTPHCTPTTKTQEYEAVLLRLRNNSPWAIKLSTEDTDPTSKFELKSIIGNQLEYVAVNNAELNLFYGVEQINAEAPVVANLGRKLPYQNPISSYITIWLPSAKAVVFVVKREELRRNLQIFMRFRYEWEVSKKDEGYDEPEHRVYFNWSNFENAAGL